MPILEERMMYDLKWNYNYNLERYTNGCIYCKKHKKEIDKWLPELLEILNNINSLLEEIMKYQKVNEEEITKGFKI